MSSSAKAIPPGTSVGRWLDVVVPDDPKPNGDAAAKLAWQTERLKRQHGLQIAVDMIAHAQNIPLRLLRRQRLKNLGETFVGMVRQWKPEVQRILTERGGEAWRQEAERGIDILLDPDRVDKLRGWVLQLATDRPGPLPPELSERYVGWFLELLPHLERQVWLTDMSNTHPAHGVARMLEHWSLFVLMWTWDNEPKFGAAGDREPTRVPEALGMPNLDIQLQHTFDREGDPGHGGIWLLAGPYETARPYELPYVPEVQPQSHWYYRAFKRYCDNARQALPELWRDIPDKAPNTNELFDAFTTRAPLSRDDAMRRMVESRRAVVRLRATCFDASATTWPTGRPGRPLSRANWETIAVLISWISRWESRLCQSEISGEVLVAVPHHRLALVTRWENCVTGATNDRQGCRLVDVVIVDRRDARLTTDGAIQDLSVLLHGLHKERQDLWIEQPSAFLARARERQHALWASQINAINQLLLRHHRRDRPVGEDNPMRSRSETPLCDEADHLLRGYAGKVCQYLLQMTRADVAFVTWLDYSVDPPRLRHVGGAERLLIHRSSRQDRLTKFSAWVDAPMADAPDGQGSPPILQGVHSRSQLYRSVARAAIVPSPMERKQATRQDDARAYFQHYPEPRPEDAIAVPLLIHGRVIGSLTVNGISSRSQFDGRLYAPLRQVAEHLAQAMMFQSQTWHMRQLNWLASDRQPEEWGISREDNGFNALGPVASLFANLFLCPVVHIWLQVPASEERYKLHGYTMGRLLLRPGRQRLTNAPVLWLDVGEGQADVGHARHFAAFAVDQWRDPEVTERLKAGSFVQATYRADARPSLTATGNGVVESEYTLENAERGDMLLGPSFVHAPKAPDYRDTLFSPQAMQQVMAFALVRDVEGEPQPVGIVGLYSPAAGEPNGSPPWTTDWRPLIAQMQTYLPYLLLQTEAIANPLYQMRRYLLHEGRSQLIQVVNKASELRRSLQGLLAIDRPIGQVRPSLRELMPGLRDATRSSAALAKVKPALDIAVDELSRIERLVEQASNLSRNLQSVEFEEGLALLARLISQQRDLKLWGDPNADPEFGYQVEWFFPRLELQRFFDGYADDWKRLGVQPNLDALSADLKVLGSRRLWNLMTQDLVRNMAKYALPHEQITVVWLRGDASSERGTLRLRNVAPYHAASDTPELLGAYGYRGSAGQSRPDYRRHRRGATRTLDGEGMGLWGAVQLGKLLDMPMTIQIEPRRNANAIEPDTAHYEFAFSIKLALVEDPNRPEPKWRE